MLLIYAKRAVPLTDVVQRTLDLAVNPIPSPLPTEET